MTLPNAEDTDLNFRKRRPEANDGIGAGPVQPATPRAWHRGVGLLAALLTMANLSFLPVHAQSLQEAMALAYRNHPALSAQRAGLRALEEDVDQAMAGWHPSVAVRAGTGHYGDTYSFREGPTTRGTRNTSELRLSASQPVLNWVTGPAIEAARARARQGRAELTAAEQSVLLDVGNAYLNVLQYRRLLALHEANERSLAREVEYRSEHFARKLGTRTELAQAQARHAGARAQLDRVRAQLEIFNSAFLRHVGVLPSELDFPEALPPLPDSLDLILAAAVEHTPAVRSAYHGAQAAQADAEAAAGRLKPSVSLEVAGGWTSRPDQSMHNRRDASVQLMLSIPIYQGSDRAQVRSGKERAIQQQSQWRNVRLQAGFDAADAWQALQSARAQVDAFTAAIAANRVAHEGVNAEHASLGELTLIEVLNAQQELFLSEVSLVQARTETALAHLRLLAVQGRLTAEGMGLAVGEP